MEKYHCEFCHGWTAGGQPHAHPPGSMIVTVAVDWLGRFVDKKKDMPEMHDPLDWFKEIPQEPPILALYLMMKTKGFIDYSSTNPVNDAPCWTN